MDHKVTAFCELLDGLYREYGRWSREPKVGQKQSVLNAKVSTAYQSIEEARLTQVLSRIKAGETVDLLSYNRFLFLKPPEKEVPMLPILSLCFNQEKVALRLRLALFTLDRIGDPAAIGFRFETPEGSGRHNYYHAQLIRGFSTGKALPQCPVWIPDSQPAFMMSAQTPYSLFLALLMSLYGMSYFEEERGFGRSLQHLDADLKEVRKGCKATSTP